MCNSKDQKGLTHYINRLNNAINEQHIIIYILKHIL